MRSMPRTLSCLKHTVSAEVQLEKFALKLSTKSTYKNIKGFYVLMSSLTSLSRIEIQYSWVNRTTEDLVVTSVVSKISNPLYILIFLVKCLNVYLLWTGV